MSRLLVENIRHEDASTDALVLDNAGNIQVVGNVISVTGNINSAGNIGAGTTTPFARSHIKDTSWSSGSPYGTVALIEGNNVNDNNWGHLVITDTTTANGNGGSIRFATGAASALNPFSGIQGTAEGASWGGIGFDTRPESGTATRRLTIDSTGNVGIGTSTPTDILDIQGADNGITIRSAEANRPKLTLINGSSTMLTISANGTYAAIGDGSDANKFMAFKGSNVGIGETSPDTLLHISGAPDNKVITLDQSGRQSAIGTYYSSGANDSRIDFYVSDGNTSGSSNNRMSITGDGRLKLETPGSTVDGTYFSTATINNTGSNTYSRLRFDRSGSARWGLTLNPNDQFSISKLYNGVNDNTICIDDEGKVGVNTNSPYGRFYVSGGVMAHAFDGGGNWRSLGSFGQGSGSYCHVKTSLTYNSYKMTMFRATGYYPYSATGHGYLGCYTYGATPGSPYGQSNFNLGNHAVAYGQYYASDSSLVLVWNWGTTYNGFWLEYLSTGGGYGNVIDVNVVAHTNSNSTSGVY